MFYSIIKKEQISIFCRGRFFFWLDFQFKKNPEKGIYLCRMMKLDSLLDKETEKWYTEKGDWTFLKSWIF